MSGYRSHTVDLRAKAGEYRNKAMAVADTELHSQFVNLADRYEELATKQEATSPGGGMQPDTAGTPSNARIAR